MTADRAWRGWHGFGVRQRNWCAQPLAGCPTAVTWTLWPAHATLRSGSMFAGG